MPTLKQLLFVPVLGGSVAFACGRDARPAASSNGAPRPAAVAAKPAQKNCPPEAEVSRAIGSPVKYTVKGIGCMYVNDDESYGADLMLGGAGSGAQLMSEVREEAQGRRAATEPAGIGEQGVIWAATGNASGAVIGNGKSVYADVTMDSKDRSATKAALLALLRRGLE
jgi:hypothetical protein